MLLTIDRVQIATPDAKVPRRCGVADWGRNKVSADRVRGLGAKRVTLRAGTGEIECWSRKATALSRTNWQDAGGGSIRRRDLTRPACTGASCHVGRS